MRAPSGRSLTARHAAALGAACALAACRGFECPAPPCASAFDLGVWCYAQGCVASGVQFTGDLFPHQVLEIPLAGLPADLPRRDLMLRLSTPDASTFTVVLDGVPGTEWPAPSGLMVWRWDAWPASPKSLTVTIDAGLGQRLGLFLVDYPCEEASPRATCPM
ncbi:MAG: hypothetical protein HY908_34785 [Myxococcales bacterium]|nr:hypothetical protein [Myxococcales bacterium]